MSCDLSRAVTFRSMAPWRAINGLLVECRPGTKKADRAFLTAHTWDPPCTCLVRVAHVRRWRQSQGQNSIGQLILRIRGRVLRFGWIHRGGRPLRSNHQGRLRPRRPYSGVRFARDAAEFNLLRSSPRVVGCRPTGDCQPREARTISSACVARGRARTDLLGLAGWDWTSPSDRPIGTRTVVRRERSGFRLGAMAQCLLHDAPNCIPNSGNKQASQSNQLYRCDRPQNAPERLLPSLVTKVP